MPSRYRIMFGATLAMLAFVCHAATVSDANDGRVTTHAITIGANGGDTASIPDFDGDGTIGFGDFLIFAGVFGASEGDEKYKANYDLNGDGEIGFSDFVIFAQNFGKDVPSPVVAIPDANLRTAIEAALGKASGVPITQADMATLDSLEANDADISDLTGLEFAVNLKWLDLSSNNITDISVLEGLTNLTHLTLSSNDIADLASLVANTGLGTGDTVDLTDNPLNVTSQDTHIPSLRARGVGISFVAPAVTIPDAKLRAAIEAALGKASGASITQAEMATLDSLEANDADIAVLTGLEFAVNLTYLSLNDNNITDISALASLTNLTRLSLGSNNITDISTLSGLTNLTVLILKSNHISDLAPLVVNKGLGTGGTIYVTDNPLNAASESTHIPALQARGASVSYVPSPVVTIPDANLRAAIEAALGKASGATITVADMKTLTELPVPGADISDLTGLEFATNLTGLNLEYNYGITNVSPLSGLTNLKTFILGCNRFTDLSTLSGLTNLTDLNIGGNDFTDISWLSGLTNLTVLNIGNNDIADISPLAGLINLTELGLGGNDLTDISPLAGLTNLSYLTLLRNDLTDISPLAGLTNLDYLDLRHNNIRDISPLSGLTNLNYIWLQNNDIRDISPLSGLTNLGNLYLADNDIRDISSLSGLTNLRYLDLGGNNITDKPLLAGLTLLYSLRLGFNNITDISLSGLTNLRYLDLKFNELTDISSLSGLTNLTSLDLRGNPLSDSSINDQVTVLESGGVRVLFDSLRKGDFDIELVFLDHLTEFQKNVFQHAARRWMSVIVEDLPDYTFTQGFSGTCSGQSYEIPSGDRIDDLRIYVSTSVSSTFAIGQGSPHLLRENTHLPVVGCIAIDVGLTSFLYGIQLHEIGHVLGFGALWEEFGFLQDQSWSDSSADTHFNGPRAIAAFDEAGGWDYGGKKVPVWQWDNGSHWRTSVLWGELMLPSRWGEQALSAITVQSLADLGYGVDVTQADAYTLPASTAGKMAAKISSYQPSAPGPVLDLTRPTISPSRNVDLYGQGRMADGRSFIFPERRWTERQESAEWVWGRGIESDVTDGRKLWSEGSPAFAEPELTCGAGLMNEPIYVVDKQGRVVRTIGR